LTLFENAVPRRIFGTTIDNFSGGMEIFVPKIFAVLLLTYEDWEDEMAIKEL
jgi:hypothetical protein